MGNLALSSPLLLLSEPSVRRWQTSFHQWPFAHFQITACSTQARSPSDEDLQFLCWAVVCLSSFREIKGFRIAVRRHRLNRENLLFFFCIRISKVTYSKRNAWIISVQVAPVRLKPLPLSVSAPVYLHISVETIFYLQVNLENHVWLYTVRCSNSD